MINCNLKKKIFLEKILNFVKTHYCILVFLPIYFCVGVFIFKDYGIGIEEHFQRSSGLYWLSEALQFTNFENLKNITTNKILDLESFTPNLPPIEIANYYGILFDLPAAFLEVFFNIKNSKNYFYLRHFLVFFSFFISGIFFYKIILSRTSNNLISFFGCAIYLLAPRIFGSSFFDGKDLFFLSILTITFYFYLNFEKKKNYISLIFFSLFCAFSTSSRIFGLILPISFLLIIFFEIINKKKILKNLKFLMLFIFLYLFFLYLHWPYLLTFDYSNFLSILEPFKVYGFYKVFFNGDFFGSTFLPLSYLPKWILISTPEFYIPLFLIGILFYLKRIFLRVFNLKEVSSGNDLWNGVNDKVDLFIFLSLFQIITIYLTLDMNLIKGWTHFIFLNFFLTYYASICVYIFYLKFRLQKKILIVGSLILSLFSLELIYQLYVFHPYQSIYFNSFVRSNDKRLYENDYHSLSRIEGIKDIITDSNKQKKIVIATASWTPLEDALSLIPIKDRNRLVFSGTANKEKADYIFTNYFYEVDVRFNKKYSIPSNFYLFKTLNIDGIKIYSIYKKS